MPVPHYISSLISAHAVFFRLNNSAKGNFRSGENPLESILRVCEMYNRMAANA